MLLKSLINAESKGYDKRPLKSLISAESVDKNALEVRLMLNLKVMIKDP